MTFPSAPRLRPVLYSAALALAALTGCVNDSDGVDVGTPRAAWVKKEPALYSYTVHHNCFCIHSPVYVTASRESVLTAEKEDPSGHRLPVDKPQDYSIEALFKEVQAQLDRKHDDQRVTFDPTYGYPKDVYIDFEKNAADEEYGLSIEDFVVDGAAIDPYDGQGIHAGTATLRVKGYAQICHGMEIGSRSCLLISENGGDYQVSDAAIHGFDFQWGKDATLKVDVVKAPPEWQDVPSRVYTLIEVKASAPSAPERFHMYPMTRDFESAANGELRFGGMGKAIGYAIPLPEALTASGAAPAIFDLELQMDAAGALTLVSIAKIP